MIIYGGGFKCLILLKMHCVTSYLELEEVREKLRNKTISWQEADLLMKPIVKKYAQACVSLEDDNGTKVCKKCWTKQLDKFDDF